MKKICTTIIAFILIFTSLFAMSCNETNDPGKNNEPKANVYTDDRMMLGMYHITPVIDDIKNQIKFEDAVNGDMFNVFLLSRVEIPNETEFDYYCAKVYEAGKRFFIFDSTYLWNGAAGNTVHKDIYVRMHNMKETLRSKTYYDAFLGYYVDEPLLLGIPLSELREASKAFRTTFPDKRFMVVFSAAGISTEYDIGAGKDRLTREGGEFITDIGFDIYGQFGDYYLDLWDTMTEMFKGLEKNYWAVPMVMNYGSRVTEDDAIGSVDGCYEVIKKTNGGVGMMLYNAYTYPAEVENIGNIGFCDMAYTTKEEFMTWKNKKDPWRKYYYKFYNEDGSQKTPGVDFVPWTRLDARIKELAAEINKNNEGKLIKAETEIVCGENLEYAYDFAPHSPVASEYIPNLKYEYAQKGSDVWTTTAPTEIGEYQVKISLEETIYRKAAEKIVDFKIVESTDTLISSALITENYSADLKTVSFNVDGYSYSVDGVNYLPYEKNSPIDVTNMISNGGRTKYIYLKEDGKNPYAYKIKSYKSITIQDFEKGANPAYSAYTVSGVIKKEGSYSGKLNFKYNDVERKYVSENYFSDFIYPQNGSNLWSIAGCTKLEFYVYSDKEFNMSLWLIADNWGGCATSQTFKVGKNEWTKLSFDLSPFRGLTSTPEYTFSHMHMLTFLCDTVPNEVFIDSISVIGLD